MPRIRPFALIAALAMGLLVAFAWTATVAQQQPKPAPARPGVPKAGAAPAQASKAVAPAAAAAPAMPAHDVPSTEQVLYLIRSALLTLNDANRSGNYSVMRDLAAPSFQAKNTAADLAAAFIDLRRRRFNLFSVALLPPQLTAVPAIDNEGRLRLSGVFPTRPLQIKFDLLFEVSDGEWKLFGIAVATPEALPQAEAKGQGAQPLPRAAPVAR